jgi:UDP-GlcNAc3NAcA epimerase
MNIITVVGARPQFVKGAVVSLALQRAGINETLVHTGQHYDPLLSRDLFEDLGMAEPSINLAVGSGSHATQTGSMMIGLESILKDSSTRFDAMIVYGDTNSTLAAALVAAKDGLPIAHVEAGLRSFNQNMPEELNRLVTDQLSTWLFCPTQSSVDQLRKEGHERGVYLSGDVMYDATMQFADGSSDEFDEWSDNAFGLLTLHRAENTDDLNRLKGIMDGLGRLQTRILFPVHPRTHKSLQHIDLPDNITKVAPQTYRSMLSLVRRAGLVLTDSGGLQKESIWLGTRCVTLREETEWTETLAQGWNQLAGADPEKILDAYRRMPDGPAPIFGTIEKQLASERIAEVLIS